MQWTTVGEEGGGENRMAYAFWSASQVTLPKIFMARQASWACPKMMSAFRKKFFVIFKNGEANRYIRWIKAFLSFFQKFHISS